MSTSRFKRKELIRTKTMPSNLRDRLKNLECMLESVQVLEIVYDLDVSYGTNNACY